MNIQLTKEYYVLKNIENGIITIIRTPYKKEDGLMIHNTRHVIRKMLFREPEIIELKYIPRSESRKRKKKGGTN